MPMAPASTAGSFPTNSCFTRARPRRRLSSAVEIKYGLRQFLHLRSVQLHSAGALHRGDEVVGDFGDHEDLLFADAEEVVIK